MRLSFFEVSCVILGIKDPSVELKSALNTRRKEPDRDRDIKFCIALAVAGVLVPREDLRSRGVCGAGVSRQEEY